MPVIKNAYPILEHDSEKHGVIKPNRHGKALLPPTCVVTFFGEVLEAFLKQHRFEIRSTYNSEKRDFPIYAVNYKGIEIGIIQAVVGSASIATMTDHLIGYGAKKIIACGGCGVLCDIPAGDVILPVSALRDEGASYHYLPPSRDISLDADILASIKTTLSEHHIPFVECKTWTTDGFYRETPDMINYRQDEGCTVVEMECATMAAVARFRGIKFGQLLYSGDILIDFDNYDERNWAHNTTAREKLFYLTLVAAVKM